MLRFKINAALLTTIIFWASAFVGIRVGLTAYTPGALALFRFIVASFFMWILYLTIPNRPFISWSMRFQMAFLGIFAVSIYHISLNYGELYTSAAEASFIIGLMPVITILLSIIFLKERPQLSVYIGISLSIFGLLMMTKLDASQHALRLGLWIVFIATWMGAIYTVGQKRFLNLYNPIIVTAWVTWGGTLMLSIYMSDFIHELQHADVHATLAVIYMGIFPAAIANVTWSYALNFLPASKASMYLYCLPLVSTGMGFIFLHEKPQATSIFGGILALIGAMVATYTRQSLPTLPMTAKIN